MARRTLRTILVGLIISVVAARSGRGEDPQGFGPDFNEAGLRRLGLPTDNANLLGYLRNAADAHADPKHLAGLIRQLGHDDFEERERASGQVIALGPVALPVLRQHLQDRDAEVARRCKDCIEEIEKKARLNVPLLAARLLVDRRPAGAAEELLRYLPWADPVTEEEIYYGLEALAVTKGQADPLLVAALKDSHPERRAVAGCILGRLGNDEQKAAARTLLRDTGAKTRLRAAQGLLAGGDKSVLPTLIELVKEPALEICLSAEEMLRWSAGDAAPPQGCGKASDGERQRCWDAWSRWWKVNGEKLALPCLDRDPRRPGLVLIWTEDEVANDASRLWISGCDGLRRYQAPPALAETKAPQDPQRLRNGNTITMEEVRQAVVVSRVVELDTSGRRVWEAFPSEKWARGAKAIYPLVRFGFRRSNTDEMNIDGAGNRIRSLKCADLLTRQASADLLAQVPPTRDTGEAALIHLTDTDARVRWNMVKVLAAAKDYVPGAIPALVRARGDSDSSVEEETSRALRKIGAEAVPALLAAYQDQTRSEIAQARALGMLASHISGKDPRIGPLVRQRLRDGTVEEKSSILRYLAIDVAATESMIPDLLRELRHENQRVRGCACWVLGTLGPRGKSAVPDLLKALSEERCRMYAASALSKIAPSEEIATKVTACLQERLTLIERVSIVYSLGDFGPKARCAVPVLIQALDDTTVNPNGLTKCPVSSAACWALGRIGPDAKAAVEKLVRIANDEKKSDMSGRLAIRLTVAAIDPESANRIKP